MEKDTYTPMFITALFAIARTWKQSKCQSTAEWIKKLYIYTMDYYSAIKRNTFESVLMRWMNLECIIQSQVSPKEKDKYHIPASFVAQLVQSLGWEDPLEKRKATHSSVLAWRIPGTGEPGGLLSTGSHGVGHD